MPAMKEEKRQYSAPALSKGLDILELLASESKGLTLRAIAQKLDRSKSEIFRMLAVLTERAYINFDQDTESYGMTLKLFDIAHRQTRVERLSEAAAPAMVRLCKKIKQSCHLVIHYEGKGIVVAQHENPEDRHFGVRLGADVPLLKSCSGNTLLAFSDEDHRRDIMALIPKKQRDLIKEKEFNKHLEQVKQLGYECIESAQIQGVRDIGYPIFDFSRKVVAVLVVPFLQHLDDSQPVNFDDSKEVLKQAAEDVSIALGYSLSPR